MMRRDMRMFEVITIINSNCLVIPNNSLTHSKSRAIEKPRAPEKSQACLCSSESRQRSTEGQGRPLCYLYPTRQIINQT